MNPQQDLIDRLIVATKEEDVLYVLCWLQKIKELNCLKEVINSRHSWKGYSAVESIIKSSLTQLRRLILQILLLEGVDAQSRDMIQLAMKERNLDVLRILMTWEKGGKEEAKDASHLLQLSLEEAADWIDQNLPPPPNPDRLTGYNDPAPNPSISDQPSPSQMISLAVDIDEPLSEVSKLRPISPILDIESSRDQSISYPSTDQPPCRPTSSQSNSSAFGEIQQLSKPPTQLSSKSKGSRNRFSPSPDRPPATPSLDYSIPRVFSDLSCFSSASSAPQDSIERLTLGNLPLSFRSIEVQELFAVIGVNSRVLSCHVSQESTYADVDVPQDQAALCLKLLVGKKIQGYTISCQITRLTDQNISRKRPHVDLDDHSPPPRSISPSDPAFSPHPFSLTLNRPTASRTATSGPRTVSRKPPVTSTKPKRQKKTSMKEREEDWKRAQGGRVGGQWGEWDLV